MSLTVEAAPHAADRGDQLVGAGRAALLNQTAASSATQESGTGNDVAWGNCNSPELHKHACYIQLACRAELITLERGETAPIHSMLDQSSLLGRVWYRCRIRRISPRLDAGAGAHRRIG